MNVPFIDLKRPLKSIRSEVLKEWERVFDETEFVNGPSVKKFETDLSKKLGTQSAIGCANGTDAILIALQGIGVKPGDKVAIPNLTFWATYEAVAQLGAIPVLIEVNPDDLQLDYDEFVKNHDKHRF